MKQKEREEGVDEKRWGRGVRKKEKEKRRRRRRRKRRGRGGEEERERDRGEERHLSWQEKTFVSLFVRRSRGHHPNSSLCVSLLTVPFTLTTRTHP